MDTRYLAQQVCIGGQCVTGALDPSIKTVADLVNRIVQFLIPLAALILLLVFIWGGYDYMMSQGSPEKLKSAQAKLTTGIIGFILLLLAFIIVRLISQIFGLGGGII
ncbi:hypothetical protein A3C98_05460 [Candidatus Roizmanbacteria bacterium RIFCSPHIGHO2_02_FULL_37_15]|uniref:Uncharacterized protein n=1 Tax=Candidatus Roizmanbacteria bacterium RIFCSPLOWO2_01_FULL_37_16 TaxID=1802058 RepID=A0A1F7IQ51_9BACT|nr:MAG: hypothetical protein A3C98_05460 [Candidatus Roizmanbacteria bacterium RIFCSPHIGHO2_02_FULL_37_15]OGK45488.1 MAG: hypothetical protein A3B40_00525 [Candidatus Roizmanbacteria bacterium RIFCSPLOWO2_01_FULL_37_16]